jgi:excisionase family DNA binding protein
MRASDLLPPDRTIPAGISQVPQPDEKLLSVKEAAALLGCTPITVYRLIYRGQLRSCRVGRSRKIHPAFIREMIFSGPVEAVQEKPAKPKGKRKPRKGKRFDDFLMP